jgi:hypothetical protein
LVYYNYNRVKFGEFEHIRKKADEIDWYISLALNKQRKRFKSSLVLLLKGLIMFVFITVIYKSFSINAKFRPKPVVGEALVKAVFSEVASFGWVIRGLNEKKTELIIRNIKSVFKKKDDYLIFNTQKKRSVLSVKCLLV